MCGVRLERLSFVAMYSEGFDEFFRIFEGQQRKALNSQFHLVTAPSGSFTRIERGTGCAVGSQA